MDILSENRLMMEWTSVGEISGIHEAQRLTYIKWAGGKIESLINFNVSIRKMASNTLFSDTFVLFVVQR